MFQCHLKEFPKIFYLNMIVLQEYLCIWHKLWKRKEIDGIAGFLSFQCFTLQEYCILLLW